MARKATPQPLTLEESPNIIGDNHDDFIIDGSRAPLSPTSPKSPRSPFKFSSRKGNSQGDYPSMQEAELQSSKRDIPPSQAAASPTPLQHSVASGGQEGQERERSTRIGFFSNYKASKSSRSVTEDTMSRDTDRPSMSGKVSGQESNKNGASGDKSVARRPVGGSSKSEAQLAGTTESPAVGAGTNSGTNKKNKPKPFSLLSRTRSIRGENDEPSPKEPGLSDKPPEPEKVNTQPPLRTAPPLRSEHDRSFRDMMSSNTRQRSEDRLPTRARETSAGRDQKENKAQSSLSTSFREGGSGHSFLNNLKTSATKGAGALSKGLFGKTGRSASTTEKEERVDDEHYELKVINKPLVEQTRLTRISKRLEESRDKTEFWMPAFPWRAIDYLNYNGSDVEGLYRVPGSGPQIKRWQRKFDEELDVDLFQQDDLYDINIIGSMLKAWLRELPDELFPKTSQDRIAREAPDSETVPQLLIDELSNLSPFNYYLLFAITCHLSLLLAHSEKNKMDFRNLCICFQPCMKIDAYCFKFLVCDWRDCWKGCKTEAAYAEQEYQLFDTLPPSSAEGRSSTAVESHDERNVSSSDSSKPSSVSIDHHAKAHGGRKPRSKEKESSGRGERIEGNKEPKPKKKMPTSHSQGSLSSADTVSTTLTIVQDRTPPRTSDLRPLSPIKPLSPIGF